MPEELNTSPKSNQDVDSWDTPYIPHRFQEKQFRKYESCIKEIVDSFPLVVTYTVTGSTTTFACRLRDAMKSLSEHRWVTDINMERFDRIHPKNDVARKLIKVSELGHNVVRISPVNNQVSLIRDRTITPASQDLLLNNEQTPSTPNPSDPSLTNPPVDFTTNDSHDLHLLCQLASKRLLTNPLIVVIEDQNRAISLMESYDVLLTPHEDNKYILI